MSLILEYYSQNEDSNSYASDSNSSPSSSSSSDDDTILELMRELEEEEEKKKEQKKEQTRRRSPGGPVRRTSTRYRSDPYSRRFNTVCIDLTGDPAPTGHRPSLTPPQQHQQNSTTTTTTTTTRRVDNKCSFDKKLELKGNEFKSLLEDSRTKVLIIIIIDSEFKLTLISRHFSLIQNLISNNMRVFSTKY